MTARSSPFLSKFWKILFFTLSALLLLVILGGVSSSAMTEDGKIVVVVDPGHGGEKDPGTCAGANTEAFYNMQVAKYLKKALEENGNFVVYLTHESENEGLTLLERGLFANEKNADLLISCHFDGMTDTSVRGVEAYLSVLEEYAKVDLGKDIVTRLSAASGMPIRKTGVFQVYDHGDKLYYWDEDLHWSIPNDPSRGQLRDYYGVIKWCAYFDVPAMIIEHGFLSNAADRAIIEKESTWQALAKADAEAIIAYYTGHTHQFGESEQCFPSNCMVQGKSAQSCSICGARQNITLLPADKDAHIWLVSDESANSCENGGYTEYTCEITRAMNVGKEGFCENHVYREELGAKGHSYTAVETQESAHGKDGYVKYRCTTCQKTYTEILEGAPHQYEYTGRTEPNCLEKGYDLYTCTVCGGVKTENETAELGHRETLFSETAATCTESGLRIYRCTVCGAEREETVEALGHTLSQASVTDVSCTENGTRSGVCDRCGTDVTEITATATGHTVPESGITETPPDCENSGNRHYVCTVCGEDISETFGEATGHDYTVIQEIPSGCETAGSVTRRCSYCLHSITEELSAAGHDYEEISRTDAACDGDGQVISRCTVCGKESIAVLPAEGHRFGKDGLCTVCGSSKAATLPTSTDPQKTKGGLIGWLKEDPLHLALAFALVTLIVCGIIFALVGRKVYRFVKKVSAEETAAEVWENDPSGTAATEAAIAAELGDEGVVLGGETAAEDTDAAPETPEAESSEEVVPEDRAT